MNLERWQLIEQSGGILCLSDRSKWLLTGADRVRYLNGQVTQDVRRATIDHAIYACVTDAKGRICGDLMIRVSAEGEGLLLDAEPSLREALTVRLDRYIVADDVELLDVTDDWGLWHVFGPAVDQVSQLNMVQSLRTGVGGLDFWLPAGQTPTFLPDVPLLTAEEWETLRILRGLPRYPQELNAETFPLEAALEARVMDYRKGCYIGQEILSRMRTTRKMPRELVRWTVEGRQEVPAGAPIRILAADGANRQVGSVTSVTRHPRTSASVGLGYVRQGALTDDSRLLVGEEPASIETLVAAAKAV